MKKILGNVFAGCLIAIGLCALVQVKAFARLSSDAARRLPLGERQYVIDPAQKYAPVEIEPTSHSIRKTQKVLRDPVHPGEAAKTDKMVLKKKAIQKIEYRVVKGPAKAKHLRFGKMAVNGKMAEPRVKFEREQLEIGRVDEPTKGQFFQKISEVTSDW